MKKNIIDLYHKARHENYPQKSGRVYSSEYTMPLSELIKVHQRRDQESIQNGMLPRSPEAIRRDAEKQYSRNRWLREGRVTNLDRLSHKQAWKLPYNPNPAQGFFPQADKFYTSQGFTSLDIETDDYNNPIAISATKFYRDETGRFRAVETFQRYYKSSNLRMQKTYPTHGLTRGILNKRRKEQGATYPEHYDWREKIELQKFLKNQIIVGHNIHEFDLPKLGLNNLYQSTIDTVTVARDIWTGQKNDLESVYQRIFGKTMAQAGFQHHDANADEIATMQILDAMMRKGSPRVRASLSYIEHHPEGVHFGTYNAYERSNLFTGNYNDYLGTSKVHTGGGHYIMTYDEDGNPLIKGMDEYMKPEEAGQLGMHEVELGPQEDVPNLAMSTIKELAQYQQSFLAGAQELATKMDQDMNSWTQMKRGALIDRLSRMDVKEENLTLKGYTGMDNKAIRELVNKRRAYYRQQEAEAQRVQEEEEAWNFSRIKGRKLRHELRHGNIDVGQFEKLSASSSWDKLLENLDKVITKNEQYANVLQKLNQIPSYDFERWNKAFTGQVGNVTGAFGNLAPSWISHPVNLLAEAGMNSMRAQHAYTKGWYRTAKAVGPALTGAGLAMLPVNPVIGGITAATGAALRAGSQVVGNMGEAYINRKGEEIAGNLNSLAFLKTTTLMPFQLLGAAVKNVTRLLHGFGGSLKNIAKLTGGQLASLGSMGNPLTEMTGVGYGTYMGTVSADYASLLGKGTINNILNNMASQRAGLYTTGDIDTKRLVAASMLGVYEQMYGSGTDEEANLTNAVNKIAQDLKNQDPFQRKTTLALANRLNPNMASILQTMDTLNISRFEDLRRPAGMWGYGEDAYERFRPRWQRAYWEYSYAGEQLNTTRNRVATSAWNMVGKRAYNYVNRVGGALADALDTGKWENVGVTIKSIWSDLKTGAEDAWKEIQKLFGMSGDVKFSDTLKDAFSKIGTLIIDGLEIAVPGILSVWDELVLGIIKKSSGLIDYLSTVHVDWHQLFKNMLMGENKPVITSLADASYDTVKKDTPEVMKLKADLRTAWAEKYGTDEGFDVKYRSLSRKEDLVRAMRDFGYGDEEYLDYLVQKGINPAAAASIHPRYGTSEDMAHSVAFRIADIYANTMTSRDNVLGTVGDWAKSRVEGGASSFRKDDVNIVLQLKDAAGNTVQKISDLLNNNQIAVTAEHQTGGNTLFKYVQKSSVRH